MDSQLVRVDLGARGYDIAIAGDGWPAGGLGHFARERCRGTSALVVTDQNVAAIAERVLADLAGAGFRANLAVRPPGEAQKSLGAAAELYDRLLDLGADRQTLVVAVGGGVIGDLAGFTAATFARGLPLLMAPTTLLAMVDSSVGGKVGVNLPRAKNMVGAVHQPIGVWIELGTLSSLPEREYRSGLAEVVKYGVALDAELFAFLEQHVAAVLKRDPDKLRHIVARCCRLKADIVEKDERETTGLRAVLNFGHTFGHAFETLSGYATLLHGEAVAIGMACASRLAERCGLIAADVVERVVRLLQAFGLPTSPPTSPPEQVMAIMRRDKKALGGRLRFVLPVRLGEAKLVEDVSEADVRAVLSGN